MTQTMHVISHTHWDREWYRPYQVFRARLIDVVDAALDLLENEPAYRYYHLDGQTIVLEDYLEIRPEREAQLRRFISEGRLLLGPWYTQPDEFLVSGEAMVRNLLLGRRMAHEFGGCMDLGYLPDSFGHASQMPQIFAGFGFAAAVIFRGVTADQVRSAFIWRSPDGTSILTVKLPDDDAYSNFQYRLLPTLSDPKPIDHQRLSQELTQLRADCESMAVCDQLLWMDGVDHIFPNPKTPEIIALANQQFQDAHVIHSTLPTFAAALQENARNLSIQNGELRYANRAWRLQAVLANVASSHIEVKIANFKAQQSLERVVEPLCTVNWLLGGEYPSNLLGVAWKHLLQNHAHDSICGCSVDQVHRDMHYRFDQTRLVADTLRVRTLQEMAQRTIATTVDVTETATLIFNPLAWTRRGTQVVEVSLPPDASGNLRVQTLTGDDLPHQVLELSDAAPLRQPKYDIPSPERKRMVKLAISTDLIAYGLTGFKIKTSQTPQRTIGTMFTAEHTFQNEHMVVSVEIDGTITLQHKDTGKCYSGLLALEDRGDGGEGWNWNPPTHDRIYLSPGSAVQVSRVQEGPLVSAVVIKTSFMVPEGFVGSAHGHDPERMQRSERMIEMPVEVMLSLRAEAKRLDIDIKLHNAARNHRVRVLFPTDLATEVCYADSAFDVVQRAIRQVDSHDWREPQLGTYPMQSFACVQDDKGGLAVLTAGTPEYEMMDEPRHTIAITLLRAFGRGAGEPHEYIDSQELGEHHYQLGLMPYQGSWDSAGVVREAREFAAPVYATTLAAGSGALETGEPQFKISGSDIDVTAVKRCDTRESVIVRMVNLASGEREVVIQLARGINTAYYTNLAEERGAEILVCEDGAIRFSTASRQIVTVELVPR